MSRPAGARAFMGLWNGLDDASLVPAYEAWHTLEHVPERVGLPGFLSARRYRQEAPAGQAPFWFTLYWLDGLDALGTPAYADIFGTATPWTAFMRTHLQRFFRLPCALGGSHGVSSTGQLATLRLRLADPGAAAWLDEVLAPRVRRGDLVAADWGAFTPTQAIPIANTGADAPVPGRDVALLLHGIEPADVARQADEVAAALASHGKLLDAPQAFQLLSEVRRDALPGPQDRRPPPREDLRRRFHPGDPA